MKLFLLLALALIPQITFADPKVPDPFCSPQDFFKYLGEANLERIHYVLDRCPNVDLNETNEKTGQSLVRATIGGNWEGIFAKIVQRKDVDFKKQLLFTDRYEPKVSPLSFALKLKRTSWIPQLLARADVDVNARDAYSEKTALHHLALSPELSNLYLELLLQQPKLDLNLGVSGYSPIEVATREGNLGFVQRLLREERTDRSRLWLTACPYSSGRGLPIFEYLLDQGWDPNVNCGSVHALELVFSGNPINESLANPRLSLAAAGVSAGVVEKLAVRQSVSLELLDAVLNHATFRPEDRTREQKHSLLHILASRQDYESKDQTALIERFRKYASLDVNAPNAGGLTPLMLAALNSSDYFRGRGETNSSFLFFANHPQTNINLVNELNWGGKKWNASATLLALNKEKVETARHLRKKGALLEQLGEVNFSAYDGYPALAHLIAVQAKVDALDLFAWLLSHPTVDLNTTFDWQRIQFTPVKQAFEWLDATTELGHARMLEVIRQLFASRRLDRVAAIKSIGTVGKFRCSALSIAVEHNLVGLVPEIVANLTSEQQASACQAQEYYSSIRNPLQLAAQLGRTEIVQYLLKNTRVPIRPVDRNGKPGFSAFQEAVQSGNLGTAVAILDAGYADEINTLEPEERYERRASQTLLYLAVEKKDVALVDRLLKMKSIDPRKGSTRDNQQISPLVRAALDDQSQIFDLIFKHPNSFQPGDLAQMVPASMGSQEKETPVAKYVRAELARFTIRNPEDQLGLQRALRSMVYWSYPVADLQVGLKKKGFDINFLLEEDYSYPTKLPRTMLSHAMSTGRLEVVQELLKTKGIDLHKGFPPLFSLIFSHSSWFRNQDRSACLAAYVAKLPVGSALPTWEGKTFFDYMDKLNRDESREAIYFSLLETAKYKIPAERQKAIIDARQGSWNGMTFEEYLDRIFSHPSFAPLAQWSEYLFDLQNVNDEVFTAFVKKWGPQLDLNVKKGNGSLVQLAVDREWKGAYDLLLKNPKVNVAELLPTVNRTYFRTRNYFFERLLELRGKDIPLVDRLDAFRGIARPDAEYTDADYLQRARAVIALLPSFEGVADRGNWAEYPLVWSMRWEDKNIARRLLTEDSTLKKQDKRVLSAALAAAIQYKRLELLDLLIANGVDLNGLVGLNTFDMKLTAVAFAVNLNDLSAAELLLQRGANVNASVYGLTAFAVAITKDDLKVAEWLRAKGAQTQWADAYNNSLLIGPVMRNAQVTVDYLVSVGADPNRDSPLVLAAAEQKDGIFTSLLRASNLDPNVQRVDPKNKARVTRALIEAARYGRLDYVEALLANPKTDKNAKDSLGYRAIDWAATNGYMEIVERLKR